MKPPRLPTDRPKVPGLVRMPLHLMHPGFAFLSTGAQLHLKAEKQENTSVVQQESDTQSQKKAFGQTLNW